MSNLRNSFILKELWHILDSMRHTLNAVEICSAYPSYVLFVTNMLDLLPLGPATKTLNIKMVHLSFVTIPSHFSRMIPQFSHMIHL